MIFPFFVFIFAFFFFDLSPCASQRLFFSQYLHYSGSSSSSSPSASPSPSPSPSSSSPACAIELFNPSACSSVSLVEFSLRVAASNYNAVSGGTWDTTQAQSTVTQIDFINTITCYNNNYTIQPMTAVSICNYNSQLLTTANNTIGKQACTCFSSLLSFDGSSSLALLHNGVIIDTFGPPLSRSPSSSSLASSSFSMNIVVGGVTNGTFNSLLTRSPFVVQGLSPYTNPDWRNWMYVDSMFYAGVQATTGGQWIVSQSGLDVGGDVKLVQAAKMLALHTFTPPSSYPVTCVTSNKNSNSNKNYTNTAIVLATCGTTASSSIFSGAYAKNTMLQIRCPADCVQVLAITQATAPLTLIGSNPYSLSSPICLAGLHSGALPLDSTGVHSLFVSVSVSADSSLSASSSAGGGILTVGELCQSGNAGQSVSSETNAAVRSGGGNVQRDRGYPLLSLLFTTSSSFSSSTSSCLTSQSLSSSSPLPAFYLSALTRSLCPSNCSATLRQGVCDQNTASCTCVSGYTGADCSVPVCNCKNGGTCVQGSCVCPFSYSGSQCQFSSCLSSASSAPCSGLGICNVSSGSCLCPSGRSGRFCELTLCTANYNYPMTNQYGMCNGRGACDENAGKCVCEAGYAGDDCSLRLCPLLCSGAGTCNYVTGSCMCANPNDTTASCSMSSCPNNCSGAGTCSMSTLTCACASGFTGPDCSISIR